MRQPLSPGWRPRYDCRPPRSSAGSIVATAPAAPSCPACRSSRCWSAGSVAAFATTATGTRRPPTSSGLGRRAPFWPGLHGGSRVERHFDLSSAADGWAPLRLPGRRDLPGDPLRRPATGRRLHCGNMFFPRALAWFEVVPPPAGGLHCGCSNAFMVGWNWMACPAAGRRAPLQHPRRRRCALIHAVVLPPIGGAPLRLLLRMPVAVHGRRHPAAGRRAPLRPASASAYRARRFRRPAAGRRAPLRQQTGPVQPLRATSSSRRWSAGSITARPRTACSVTPLTSSRRWSAGSIAASLTPRARTGC